MKCKRCRKIKRKFVKGVCTTCYQKEWRSNHSERQKKYNKKYYQTEKYKKYYKKSIERTTVRTRQDRRIRMTVLEILERYKAGEDVVGLMKDLNEKVKKIRLS